MSFTTPLARIKEHERPASNSSEVRRPSRYQTTNPQTIPSGRPLAKRAKILSCGGSAANNSSAISATATRPMSMESRRPRVISEQNLMPKYLDSAYPTTWLITNAVFSSICVPSSERPSK